MEAFFFSFGRPLEATKIPQEDPSKNSSTQFLSDRTMALKKAQVKEAVVGPSVSPFSIELTTKSTTKPLHDTAADRVSVSEEFHVELPDTSIRKVSSIRRSPAAQIWLKGSDNEEQAQPLKSRLVVTT